MTRPTRFFCTGVRISTLALCVGVCTPANAQDTSTAGDAGFDLEAGAAQYKSTCRRCHGPTAKGLASFPKLVGQSQDYLADRLTRYRKGEKIGPNTGLMAPVAKTLSDQDILNLSHFIASLE